MDQETYRQYFKLSDVEKIVGAYVQKPTINAIIVATKQVIDRKRQLPYIMYVNRILFNQMIKERTSIITGAGEVSSSLKWDPIELKP